MQSKISIVKCTDYQPEVVFEALKKSLALLGGIANFVRPASSVLVKPNLLMAKEPQFGITTHPQIVRSVIKLLKEINCEIYVGDGPSVWGGQAENIDEVYERTGIREVCHQEDVKLIKFDKSRWRGKFSLTCWLDTCDYLVNVPKFKTHELTTLTGAIKNLFGLVYSAHKTQLHKDYFQIEDFARILVDIYKQTRPALTIIDAVSSMEGDGPATSGKLRNLGLLLAGADCLALDSCLAIIMGLSPLEIPTNKAAAAQGLGISDINSINILGARLEDIKQEAFQLPATSIKRHLPKPVIELAKKLIKYYPCVERDNCTRCAICIASCPNKAISLKKKSIVFDYSKCIYCFCCQETCPKAAIKVRKSIAAKIIGL
ncbi:MAG: DUF362 domain-containing protein [Candidatus Omnitrophota bacterium]